MHAFLIKTMRTRSFYIFFMAFSVLTSCKKTEAQSIAFKQNEVVDQHFDLEDIQNNGELIVLSITGPDCFEFKGEYFGRQYMLANAFAASIGTSIRIETCRSEKELLERLAAGDGDIIAYNISDRTAADGYALRSVHADTLITSWAVNEQTPQLADALSDWVAENSKNLVAISTHVFRSKSGRTYTPRRRVSAPIRNLAKGEISLYDKLFRQYSSKCGWDWRLLAAQAYQESAFDPEAISWMGAMGILQLMPATARSVGVSQAEIFNPEANIRGAVRLINQLDAHYADIHPVSERINFILAAYNAGPGHVDDARAIARKYGRNPDVWLGNVDGYVLRMSDPKYYNQPEVTHGYFRGSETHDYVNSIRTRWDEYRRKI